MNHGQSRSSPDDTPAFATTLPMRSPLEPEPGDPGLWRRRLRHDIRHELGTIIMLASAVVVADDIGAGSRERIEQLLGETRWLDHLLRRLDEDDDAQPLPCPERNLSRVGAAPSASPHTAHTSIAPKIDRPAASSMLMRTRSPNRMNGVLGSPPSRSSMARHSVMQADPTDRSSLEKVPEPTIAPARRRRE